MGDAEAQPHEAFAVRPEGRARREADAGLVDQAVGERAAVGFALDRQVEIEGAVRPGEADVGQRRQRIADDVPARVAARDHLLKVRLAPFDGGDGAVLQEGRHAGRVVLDQVLEHLAERLRPDQPADAPAGHRPVLREGADDDQPLVRRADLQEGRRDVHAIDQAAVDLVGDDPQAALPGEVAHGDLVLPAHRPAGRVARRVDEEGLGARADGIEQPVEIERPAGVAEAQGHADDPAADDIDRRADIRPHRRRRHHLVVRAEQHLHGLHDRLHAADGDDGALRRDVDAVDPAEVGAERPAQGRDAALVCVEGLSRAQRLDGRLADEVRRRQVALADPERDQVRYLAPVVGELDDAAFRNCGDARVDGGKKLGVAHGRLRTVGVGMADAAALPNARAARPVARRMTQGWNQRPAMAARTGEGPAQPGARGLAAPGRSCKPDKRGTRAV